MVAEAIVGGIELAPEGYGDTVHVNGVLDMIFARNQRSFRAYRYPSQQPADIQRRTVETTGRLLRGIGYDKERLRARQPDTLVDIMLAGRNAE